MPIGTYGTTHGRDRQSALSRTLRAVFRSVAVGAIACGWSALAEAQSVPTAKAAFAACAMCHGTTAAERKIGPPLAGVVGRRAGSVPGYAYSAAFRKLTKIWTPRELDAFLKAPQKTVPGSKMVYAGMADNTRRASIIAYLAGL